MLATISPPTDKILPHPNNLKLRGKRILDINYRVGQKTGPFLNVNNFATVSGRKACDMSKVCKFCPEKNIKLS